MWLELRPVGWWMLLLGGGAALWLLASAQSQPGEPQGVRLQEIRNLGKAFYETPGSSRQAVEQLARALELNPGSAREHLNYGLALLRAGQREAGIAEVMQAQKLDRTLPHTYFNLGIEYKKAGEVDKALDQLLQMEKLVPDEAKTQYNLGALYKQQGNIRRAIEKFERAIGLAPSLAAPHFQLFGILRRTDSDRAMRELEIFKRLKAATEDAAVGEDVDWSFYSELYDPSLATGVAMSAVPFAFGVRQVGALSGTPLGLTMLDINGDGVSDALGWSSEAAVVVAGTDAGASTLKVAGLGGAQYYAPGDFDGDGLADLCRVDGAGVAVLINQAGRSFRSVLAASGDFDTCLFADYDRDNDFDLFALGGDKRLLQNDGEGGLADVSGEFPFESGRVRAAVTAELFEDNGHDLIAVYGDRIAVHQDLKLGRFAAAAVVDDTTVPDGILRLDVIDIDHDGYLDIAVTSAGQTQVMANHEGALRSGPVLEHVRAWADFQLRGRLDAATDSGFLANRGRFDFLAMSANEVAQSGPASAGDLNGDGRPDLLIAAEDGQLLFAANRTETDNRGLTVRLEGVKSPAIGTEARVEIKAGLTYAKQVYTGVPLHFGLGTAEALDTIRVTWANGLIQNEMPSLPLDEVLIKEAPRLSGSCPMVYTWNGSEFEYIGEVLGVAPLGASLARDVYFPVDHDEYVTIRGDQLAERAGFLDLRLTEELREVAYIDKVRLLAVDHPQDLRVIVNEKAKSPPFPEFKLYGVRSPIQPVGASNHRGEDILDLVSSSDRRYPLFERTHDGRAERHQLTLHFPHFDADAAVLFLEGWVDWSSASTLVAASQTRSRAVQPPYLEVQDENGNWVTAVADAGLPGGTLRTIPVDLGGKFLSASRSVRLVTNMCVYWDSAFIAVRPSAAAVRVTTLKASVANLRFRGFSRNFVAEGRAQPESFDYQQVSATTNWNPTPGRYTRFGPVHELLDQHDDRFVIMGAGDEIELRFRSAELPALASGQVRDYLLLVDGWAKENEANTAFGDSVEPLPFHSMSGYPPAPGESYPATPLHQADLVRYHTRPALRLIRPLVARGTRQ